MAGSVWLLLPWLVGCAPEGLPVGEERWFLPIEGGVASRPAVADGVVYVSAEDGRFYAVDAASGSVLWEEETGGGPSSPAVGDDVVVAGGGDRIYALSVGGGGERWMFGVGQDCRGAALVAEGVAYAGCDDGVLYALDTFHGGVHWRLATGGPIVGRPALAEGLVVFGSWDGWLYAVDVEATEADYDALGGLTEVTPQVAWSVPLGDYVSASPVAERGRVWVGAEHDLVTPDDAVFYALDLATGAVAWSARSLVGVQVYAGAAVEDERLYVATENWYEDGRPDYLFRLDSVTGLERWNRELDGSVLGEVALSEDGTTVVVQTTAGTVYAVDAASGEVRWTVPGSEGPGGVALDGETAFFGVLDEGLYAVAPPG